MKYAVLLLLGLCVLLSASQGDSIARPGPAPGPGKTTVVVIPVAGDVDPGMAAYLGRALRDAQTHPNPTIVLEMDTFGGRLDAAFQMVDSMLTVPLSITTVAFVKTKAISAGALIALTCNRLFMRPSTTMGDCAPIAISEDGPKMLGEKVQSPLRAKFRSLAKRNKYPQALSESMVSVGMTVYRIAFGDSVVYMDSVEYADLPTKATRRITEKKTVVATGELLTMDDQEAVELGFSSGSVATISDMLAQLGIADYEMVRIEESWSESFVRFIGRIAPLLIILGLAGVYIESKSPGFGVPGILGLFCLGLVLGSQYMAGWADYTELVILVFGLVLLAAEVFVVPGFGIVGIAGIAAIAAALLLSMQDFVLPKPEIPWQRDLFEHNIKMLIASLAGMVAVVVLFFKYLFPRISTMIAGPRLEAVLGTSRIAPSRQVPVNVGDRGTVSKPLRPAGSATIGEDEYDVVTDGDFVEKGAAVKVIEVRGNTIVVLAEDTND